MIIIIVIIDELAPIAIKLHGIIIKLLTTTLGASDVSTESVEQLNQ